MKFYLSSVTYDLSYRDALKRRDVVEHGTAIIKTASFQLYELVRLSVTPVLHDQVPYELTIAERNEAMVNLKR